MIYNPSQRTTAHAFLDAILDKGKRVRVERVAEKRNLDQNALMWLWLSCISQHTGHEKDELHDYFRAKYLPIQSKDVMGETLQKLTSTTSLNTAEFAQYLTKIQTFAISEIGVQLPDPADLHFAEFVEHYKNFI